MLLTKEEGRERERSRDDEIERERERLHVETETVLREKSVRVRDHSAHAKHALD